MFAPRQNWATFLAVKAITLSIVAMAAAFVLGHLALPKLAEALNGMGRDPSALVLKGIEYQAWIPILPTPGLLLGIWALMFRSLRTPLAVLAMLLAVAATVAVVLLLLGSMAPLYQVPRDLSR